MVIKTSILLAGLFMLIIGCKKEGAANEKLTPEIFVQQLKRGTYKNFEKGENGEQLWLKLPDFNSQDIDKLIKLSQDTTHIDEFPTNPISSFSPLPRGRNYFILGEGLLWIVERIRGAGSLVPYMIDTSKEIPERFNGIAALEVLDVCDKYKEWWDAYKNGDWKNKNPLENTTYRWF